MHSLASLAYGFCYMNSMERFVHIRSGFSLGPFCYWQE